MDSRNSNEELVEHVLLSVLIDWRKTRDRRHRARTEAVRDRSGSELDGPSSLRHHLGFDGVRARAERTRGTAVADASQSTYPDLLPLLRQLAQ